MMHLVFFFFFKQKTAYEMRISDWSSDVCSSDLIHSFSIPAFWLKEDAVPGRINERTFTIEKPGVYYGQCSELCGVRHGFMPIAVEALPPAEFDAWVASQGGHAKGAEAVEAAAPAAVEPAVAANYGSRELGRAHVSTPAPNAHPVRRLMLETQ